jgi:Mn2+/Fe2+ NRAMP family transporter
VPVLAGGVAYAFAETFDIPLGLSKTWKQAKGFYGIITLSVITGVLLTLSNIDPIAMLYYSAAINGILAAPLLIILIMIANNKKILGEHRNGKLSNFLTGVTAISMGIISILTVYAWLA